MKRSREPEPGRVLFLLHNAESQKQHLLGQALHSGFFCVQEDRIDSPARPKSWII